MNPVTIQIQERAGLLIIKPRAVIKTIVTNDMYVDLKIKAVFDAGRELELEICFIKGEKPTTQTGP